MTTGEFAQYLNLGHELSGIEFKGPGPLTNGRLAAQVIKAVLGMANRQDGGSVIIGVNDNDSSLGRVGVSEDDLLTWTYDAVADQIARYADPGVGFELEVKEHDSNRYVILEVAEFDDIPVLCKRAYGDVLRDGACYVRTRRKPETSELPTQVDMRDLLSLAIEKGVRNYIRQAQRVGIISVQTTIRQELDEGFSNQGIGAST